MDSVTGTQVDEFLTFMREQVALDRRKAEAATAGPWSDDEGSVSADGRDYLRKHVADAIVFGDMVEPMAYADSEHIANWDPDRALARCDAMDMILDRYEQFARPAVGVPGAIAGTRENIMEYVVRVLGSEYVDRPGYRRLDWWYQ